MKRFFMLLFSAVFFQFSFAQNQEISREERGTRDSIVPFAYINDSKRFTKDALPENAFVFYVIGDWGRRGKHGQTAVATAMNTCAHVAKPAFIISTGDNFYTFGVRSVKDKLWKKSFENVYSGDSLKNVVWYPVLGNHDHYGNENAEVAYSKINPRWQMPSDYFSLTIPQATFVFTNTEPLVHSAAEAQWKFIDSTLAAAKTKWKFVVGHHPVYSSNKTHGNTPVLIEKLQPILEKYGVQAYFAGHDHDLQHQQPKGSKVDYFVSGAGSELRPSSQDEHTLFARSVNGFAIVALTENEMRVYFVDKNANIVYSYVKK